ncbi:NfeD family protein [Bacillus andreraoultii]|uniref:NfeD family protein n=1 Tax=Bacillus andreraoultii TaxID=1499685 RepID=UPI00053BB07F|nr:nodulation protein NfeD [Bacillus andreraoultii]
MKKRYVNIFFFILLLPLIFFFIPFQEASAKNSPITYAKVDSEVTKGLTEFIGRAISIAEDNGSESIIFELHTPGGAVDAASDIAKLLRNTDVKTIAFINNEALSAGAYIALNMDEIYMVPNATMGAAAVITQDGNAADKKAQSYWLAAMKSAAEQSGRDPIYAMAMADDSINLPKYDAPKGKLLTLTASQSLEVGYAEGVVKSKDELLNTLGYSKAQIEQVDKSWSERIAEFVTNPFIIPILLSIGSLGLILELYSPGFGLPGIAGLSSLLLFFYGHYIAGLAGYESLILFILGIILIVVELFVPGGILGFLGLGSILMSIIFAGENVVFMTISLFIAIVVAITAMVILVKFFGKKNRLFGKIVLRDSTSSEQGYVSNSSRTDLLNKEGITLTPLRPSGTIIIENERVDAVTEGGFIDTNVKVIVVKVEGVRVVVRELKD